MKSTHKGKNLLIEEEQILCFKNSPLLKGETETEEVVPMQFNTKY